MRKKDKPEIRSSDQAMRDPVRLITSNSKHGTYRMLSEFLTLAACSIIKGVDFAHREERETLYMRTIKGYDQQEANCFAQMLGLVVMGLEPTPGQVEFRNVGCVIHAT